MAKNKSIAFCPNCFEKHSKIEEGKNFTCSKCKSELLPVRVINDSYFLVKKASINSDRKVSVKQIKKVEAPHLDFVNFSNDKDLEIKGNDEKVLNQLIKGKNFKKALEYIDDIRNDKRNGYDAPLLYYYEMLARAKAPDYDSFVQDNGFEDEDIVLLKKAFKLASNETGADLLVALYNTDSYHPTCYDFFKLTLPYVVNPKVFSKKERSQLLNNAFIPTIKMRDKEVFNLLVSALDEDDVDTYLKWLLRLEYELGFEDKDLALIAIDYHASDVDTLNDVITKLIEENGDEGLLTHCIDLLLSNPNANPLLIIQNLLKNTKHTKGKDALIMRLLPYVEGRKLFDCYQDLLKYADESMEEKFYQEALAMYSACIPFVTDVGQQQELFLKMATADAKDKKSNIKNSPYYVFYELYENALVKKEKEEIKQNKIEKRKRSQTTFFRGLSAGIVHFFRAIGRFFSLIANNFKIVVAVGGGLLIVTVITLIVVTVVNNNNIKAQHAITHFSLAATNKEKNGDGHVFNLKFTFTFTNNSFDDISWVKGKIITATKDADLYSGDVILRTDNEVAFKKGETVTTTYTIPYPANTKEQSGFKKLADTPFSDIKISFNYNHAKFASEKFAYYYHSSDEVIIKYYDEYGETI